MAGWPIFSGAGVGIALGVGNWWTDGDRNCFWRLLSLNIWRSQHFYGPVKLVVLAYALGNSEALVTKGRHFYDDIVYYDTSVVQTFVGTERPTQLKRILLAELSPLHSSINLHLKRNVLQPAITHIEPNTEVTQPPLRLGRADHGVLGV